MSLLTIKSNRKSASNIYQDSNLYIIICITLIALLGVLSIDPALPILAEGLNIPPQQIGLVIATYILPITIGTPIFSVLADRFGRKQILVPSLLVFALGGVLSAFAQDFRSLLEWRFLQGIGAASLESLALTLIADLYAGKILTAAMAFNASVIGISAALYPLIGGVLAGFSWRYPFLLTLCAIPLALLVLTTLKLPKQTSAQDFNLNAYLKNTWRGINNRQVLGLLFAVTSLFMMQFGACYTYLPILVVNSLGASGAVIGIILAIMSLSLAFAASQLGLFARKLSEITLIKVSFIVYALALLIIPAIHNVWLLLIPSILIGAAEGMAFPTIRTLLARLAPSEYRAGFMSVNATFQSVGQVLGPILAGIAFGLWGMQGVFYACAGFALVTLVLLNSLLTQRH